MKVTVAKYLLVGTALLGSTYGMDVPAARSAIADQSLVGQPSKVIIRQEGEDKQAASNFAALNKDGRMVVYSRMDMPTLKQMSLVCRLFRRELHEEFFHPLALLQRFEEVSQQTPLYYVKYEEGDETINAPQPPEMVAGFVRLAGTRPAAVPILFRILFELDPATYFRSICLGGYMARENPWVQQWLQAVVTEPNFGVYDYWEFAIDMKPEFVPVAKRHFMALKLLALSGDDSARQTMKAFADKAKAAYQDFETPLAGIVLEARMDGFPLHTAWVTYTDELDCLSHYWQFMTNIPWTSPHLESAEPFRVYLDSYIKHGVSAKFAERVKFWGQKLVETKVKYYSLLGRLDEQKIAEEQLLQQVVGSFVPDEWIPLARCVRAITDSCVQHDIKLYQQLLTMLDATMEEFDRDMSVCCIFVLAKAKVVLASREPKLFREGIDCVTDCIQHQKTNADIDFPSAAHDFGLVDMNRCPLEVKAIFDLYLGNFTAVLDYLETIKTGIFVYDIHFLRAMKSQMTKPNFPNALRKKVGSLLSKRFSEFTWDTNIKHRGQIMELSRIMDEAFMDVFLKNHLVTGHPFIRGKLRDFFFQHG